MHGIQLDWLDCVRAWAAREPLILEVHFFGSRVKGTHHDNSDLDIAVLVDGATEGEALANAIFGTKRWKQALAALLPVAIDLDCMRPDDVVVTPAVREHGMLVYAKSRG